MNFACHRRSRLLFSVAGVAMASCVVGFAFLSSELDVQKHLMLSEQVAQIPGPFISADIVEDRDTHKPGLIGCSKDAIVRTFDMKGRELKQWQISDSIGQVLVFTASTQADAFAAMDHNGDVFFGRLSRPDVLARGKAKVLYSRLLFSQDGKWLVAFTKRAAQVWQTADWSEVPAFRQDDSVGRGVDRALAFFKKGNDSLFATAGFQSRSIAILALPDGTMVRSLSGDEQLDRKFVDLVATPDSRFLVAVTTAADRLAVWNIATGEIVTRPKAFPTGIGNRLAISEDGKILICSQALHSSRSRTGFRVYQVNNWAEIGLAQVQDDAPESDWENLQIVNLSIDSTGSSVATLHGGGQIRLWQLRPK